MRAQLRHGVVPLHVQRPGFDPSTSGGKGPHTAQGDQCKHRLPILNTGSRSYVNYTPLRQAGSVCMASHRPFNGSQERPPTVYYPSSELKGPLLHESWNVLSMSSQGAMRISVRACSPGGRLGSLGSRHSLITGLF